MCLWIDTHQTIVAAVIVFFGVIVGLIGNLLVGMVDRGSKRKHERESVRAILFAELTFLKETYDDRVRLIDDLQAGDSDMMIVTADPQTQHYHELMDKLGVLPADTLTVVLPAYLAADHLQAELRASEWRPTLEQLPGEFIAIPRTNVVALKILFQRHSKLIGSAIDALKKVAT